MGIFSKNKNKENLMIILDIGSGSVGGAFVEMRKNKNNKIEPVILRQTRTQMKYQDEIDFEKFSFYMNKALNDTIHNLMMFKIGYPTTIHCTLSSPWYVSETRTIHMEKEDKFFTSKKIIDSLIEKELKNVILEYQKKYENNNDKPKLLENVVLESLINGYKVQDIFNKKASVLDIITYLSLSPDSVISMIKNTVKKVFPHTDLHFGSFAMSFYNAIRLKYPKSSSHLLVDVNAEITDVSMVIDGILTSFFSFPIGRNYILRKIIKIKKCTQIEAESLFALYVTNTMEEKKKKEMINILGEVEKDWKNIFYKSITEISKITGYTDEVYLVSHNDSSLYFSHILENPNVPLAILGDRKFSVQRMTGEELKSLCKVESGACDEFLMSEALCSAYVYKL